MHTMSVHYPDGDCRSATAPYVHTTDIACLWKRGGKHVENTRPLFGRNARELTCCTRCARRGRRRRRNHKKTRLIGKTGRD